MFAFDELNIPVDKVNPARFNIPLVRVTVPVAAIENAAANDVVADEPSPPALAGSIASVKRVALPLLAIVPVPIIDTFKLVYTPVADKTKEFTFTFVAAIVKAVVPKLRELNQLPVVIVAIDAPLTR